jgi:5-methylcytosine-specific restriction protein A
MPITKGQGNPDWTREETVLALDLLRAAAPRIPGKTSVEVRALSDLLQRLPLHPPAVRNDKFRNREGVYLKLQNLASLRPDKGARVGLSNSAMDRAVSIEFLGRPGDLAAAAELVRRGLAAIEAERIDLPEVDEDEEFLEGRLLTRLHKARERDHKLRSRVIARARRATGIRCEACGAKPRIASSAALEAAEFEVHHVQPLALAVERRTRLDDVALLCAGCHRLVHALSRDAREHAHLDLLRRALSG